MALIIVLQNISLCAPLSDYNYDVLINKTRIASGKVLQHRREGGWPALLQQLLDQRVVEPATLDTQFIRRTL